MWSCALLMLCALTIALQVQDVTPWSFRPTNVSPLLSIQSGWKFQVRIMCQADTALDKCQVNIYNKQRAHDFVDLSRGANSGVQGYRFIDKYGDVSFYNVRYVGTGLENGQCGAEFTMFPVIGVHYGCRGATAAGEWQDMNVILTTAARKIPASITPKKAIAKPGSNVSILLHSKPMISCTVVPTTNRVRHIDFVEGKTDLATGSYRYFGSSPSRGDCGITLLNVIEENNGPIAIHGTTSDKQEAALVSIVIIATPPAEVSFKVNKMSYSVGDTLNATCSSLLSRPVANLTWTLDGKIIRQDAKKDLDGDVWTWSWDKQNITQNLSLKLEEEDFGKMLECRVQHLDIVHSNSSYVIKRLDY